MTPPCEMHFPAVAPRVVEGHHLACYWINASNVRTFVFVAVQTCESEVFQHCCSAMLLGNHVIHLEHDEVELLRHSTVFASVLGTSPDLGLQGGVDHDSGSRAILL